MTEHEPHLEDLKRSGLSETDALEAHFRFVSDAREEVDEQFLPVPATVIPYFDPSDKPVLGEDNAPFTRLRYHTDRVAFKYHQRKGSGCRAYLPPRAYAIGLNDPEFPLFITEGEKKALSMLVLCSLPCVGLGGVWNFYNNRKPLPCFHKLALKGRRVYILYDSDAETNPHVRLAEVRLAEMLTGSFEANVNICRLPQSGDEKVGLDDYLVSFSGQEERVRAIAGLASASVGKHTPLIHDIRALNTQLAWIETEGNAWELQGDYPLSPRVLKEGSKYSAKMVSTEDSSGRVRKRRLTEVWLTHSEARRYEKIIFDPSTASTDVLDGHAICYNRFHGFPPALHGGHEPFLALTHHMFSSLPLDLQDFAIKLFAWRLQNLHLKRPPISLFLVSAETGTGKSMWSEILVKVFDPYSVSTLASLLESQFTMWVENKLLCALHEVTPSRSSREESRLRTLITEDRMRLEEKYRASYDARLHASFILSSNSYKAVPTQYEERRLFVVEPRRAPDEVFRACGEWMRDPDYGRRARGYLQTLPLQGWEPPLTSPMTLIKSVIAEEGKSDIEKVAAEMLRAEGYEFILQSILTAKAWAIQQNIVGTRNNDLYSIASTILEGLGQLPIRPWYTEEELAFILPNLITTTFNRPTSSAFNPSTVGQKLREHGVRVVQSENPEGFLVGHVRKHFLLVSDYKKYMDMRLTQQQFDGYMKTFGTFQDYEIGMKEEHPGRGARRSN